LLLDDYLSDAATANRGPILEYGLYLRLPGTDVSANSLLEESESAIQFRKKDLLIYVAEMELPDSCKKR
jgi:hypothetical protein